MTKGAFEGVWRHGRRLIAFDESTSVGREFYGFIEPLSFGTEVSEVRDRAGIVPAEKYRLIAEPSEEFSCGTATRLVCGNMSFELVSVKEVFDGEKITHRECVLLKTGEVASNA